MSTAEAVGYVYENVGFNAAPTSEGTGYVYENVNQYVSSDLDLRWGTGGYVSSDLDLRWNVGGGIASDLDLRWNVAGMVASDLNLRWNTRTDVASARMLAYLPPYYAASAYVAALMIAAGLHMDEEGAIVDSFPTFVRPQTCPEWVLALWEASLGFGDRSGLSAAQRRDAIVSRLRGGTPDVARLADLKTYIERAYNVPASGWDLVPVAPFNYDYLVSRPGLTATQGERLMEALAVAAPAHLVLTTS